jgi:hypothetical protein
VRLYVVVGSPRMPRQLAFYLFALRRGASAILERSLYLRGVSRNSADEADRLAGARRSSGGVEFFVVLFQDCLLRANVWDKFWAKLYALLCASWTLRV